MWKRVMTIICELLGHEHDAWSIWICKRCGRNFDTDDGPVSR